MSKGFHTLEDTLIKPFNGFRRTDSLKMVEITRGSTLMSRVAFNFCLPIAVHPLSNFQAIDDLTTGRSRQRAEFSAHLQGNTTCL